jgi:hypothetical protein
MGPGPASSAGGGSGISGGLGAGGSAAGSSFLGTSSGTSGSSSSFLTSGYEPGSIGQASKAGNKSATNTGDLFARFYVNQNSLGMGQNATGSTSYPAFGTPLYSSLYSGYSNTVGLATNTSITGTIGTSRVGTGGIGGGLGSFTPATGTIGGIGGLQVRPPAHYTTAIAFKYKTTTPVQLRTDLQQILARSTDLANNRTLEVSMDGQTVVLRGKVTDPDLRRLAENMLRLTPGVKMVRNELQVEETAPPPKVGQ